MKHVIIILFTIVFLLTAYAVYDSIFRKSKYNTELLIVTDKTENFNVFGNMHSYIIHYHYPNSYTDYTLNVSKEFYDCIDVGDTLKVN